MSHFDEENLNEEEDPKIYGIDKNYCIVKYKHAKPVVAKYVDGKWASVMPAEFNFIDKFVEGKVGPKFTVVTQGKQSDVDVRYGYMSLPFASKGYKKDLIYTIGIKEVANEDGTKSHVCQLTNASCLDDSAAWLSVPYMETITNVDEYKDKIMEAWQKVKYNQNLDYSSDDTNTYMYNYDGGDLLEYFCSNKANITSLDEFKKLVANIPAYKESLDYIRSFNEDNNDVFYRKSLFDENGIKNLENGMEAFFGNKNVCVNCWSVGENGEWKSVDPVHVFMRQNNEELWQRPEV